MLSPGLLTHWTRQALDAAFAGDEGMVAVTADLIADGGDALDLLSSCRVVADTAVRALLVLYRAPDTAGGEVWVLDQLGDTECPPGLLFAARVVTAYANRDTDLVTALVVAAAGATRNERAESLRSLVTYAAGLDAQAARQKETNE
ncbi:MULTISPECIES: hypothetical protein [unclassified Streptomyces]|uniref:hypothetical protein n=1 Tax=unclassified Streptomyces TaxID=2593676 RepID=UPI0020245ED6|nr:MULTISPECIES: hypothetical protein [unclassified Streptomyces]MCX4550542.1 hypothetical protein [Streptomyces sp. NBC_01500]WSC21989.1 hypothetical protein OIE60_21175 [Streptomyces sp. NBC_01766]